MKLLIIFLCWFNSIDGLTSLLFDSSQEGYKHDCMAFLKEMKFYIDRAMPETYISFIYQDGGGLKTRIILGLTKNSFVDDENRLRNVTITSYPLKEIHDTSTDHLYQLIDTLFQGFDVKGLTDIYHSQTALVSDELSDEAQTVLRSFYQKILALFTIDSKYQAALTARLKLQPFKINDIDKELLLKLLYFKTIILSNTWKIKYEITDTDKKVKNNATLFCLADEFNDKSEKINFLSTIPHKRSLLDWKEFQFRFDHIKKVEQFVVFKNIFTDFIDKSLMYDMSELSSISHKPDSHFYLTPSKNTKYFILGDNLSDTKETQETKL